MSFANPTPLRIGTAGALHSWRVRVAGRVVLGVEIEGATYTWQEFHLVGDSGGTGTLVYEEGEHGPEWKLFRAFQPLRSLPAREAATKRVGDTVNLDGTPTRITLVDESRVLHIEGTPPEGVAVGDIAHYFNADTGRRMLVASWTGDEIEFYEGEDVPGAFVAKAFNLAAGASAFRPAAGASALSGSGTPAAAAQTKRNLLIVAVLFGLIVLFAAFSCARSGGRPAGAARPATPQSAPPQRLKVGASGTLGGEVLRVTGSSVVELARVNGRRQFREYALATVDGRTVRLVQGIEGLSGQWHLLRPQPVPTGLTPHDAATLRRSGRVALDGSTAQLTELFRARTASRDGEAADLGAPGAIRYGWLARTPGELVVARWNEQQIEILGGKPLPERDLLAAFPP
jgi:hypothetical protein